MDRVANPFVPGAGNPPPELAGRSAILERAEVVLHRLAAGRHDKSQLLPGLRGVGKTVLLNKIEQLAEELGAQTVLIEDPRKQRRGIIALRNFASAFKIAMDDIEFSVSPEPGLADSGELQLICQIYS